MRRKGSPGPAIEHVFQYRLSAKSHKRASATAEEALVTKAADLFYERQYRQFLNATMGVFAMTAKLALLGCGGRPKGTLWSRHRPVHAAMVEETEGASPIIVLDHQTIAVPLFLPMPATVDEVVAIDRWLASEGQMPPSYRQLVEGKIVSCATPYARALRRTAVGALVEVVDAVRNAGKLAVLALHPYDPDAMGLHITLFGTEALTIETVQHDYAIDADTLYPWRYAAWSQNCLLRFCVGGVEEAFTQCSQNLFVKRPAEASGVGHGTAWRSNWSPAQPLDQLVASQFELLQVTVSSSGLPGASPRNGDIGKAAFIARRGRKTSLLVPYFTGNAVHGHAAKLWSNPQGAIVIWDDHRALSAVTITGPSRVVEHTWVARYFPHIAKKIAARQKRNGLQASDPEYWFEQEVAEIILQDEPLAQNILDPVRPTCSIHAAGLALHGKKPAYFAADSPPSLRSSMATRTRGARASKGPVGRFAKLLGVGLLGCARGAAHAPRTLSISARSALIEFVLRCERRRQSPPQE